MSGKHCPVVPELSESNKRLSIPNNMSNSFNSNTFNYGSTDNHVEKRHELSEQLQVYLAELQQDCGTREQWPHHERFAGEAEFWLQVHKALLGAAAELPERCASLLLILDDPVARKKQLTQLSQLGGQLIHHAHTHHHVEDHHFFPVFKRAYPKLNHHLELLDGDHRVLTEVLDQLETAFKTMPVINDGTDKANKSLLTVKAEELYHAARRVDKLFSRHIGDEEEICIPALLKL